jgi:EmrB/QacA subfamily drug resistance transporter
VAHRNRVLAIASVATFLASLDLFIVNVAFPDIQLSFPGTSDAALSWVLNAYAIVVAALLVPFGRLADLVGRKRVFVGGLAVFLLASALCAAANSVGLLVAARVLQAAGGAALLPTSLALVLAAFPAEKRGGAVAIWSATGAVSAAAGPPIGGLLVQASWHWVFLVNLPVGLVMLYVAIRFLEEVRDPARGARPDLLGVVLLVAGVAGLTLSLVKAPEWGWGSPAFVATLAAAIVFLIAFVRRSATHDAPVVELELFRHRSFAFGNAAALVFFAAFGAMLLGSVLFLTRVWHEDVLTAGLMIAPGPLMAGLFSLPAGLLGQRIGARAVAVPGALIYGLGGLWWVTQLTATPNFAADYLPGMLIGGIGVGLVIPTLAAATTRDLPPARYATGSGVFGMARQLGVALGVAILLAIIGSKGSTVDGFTTGFTWMVAAEVIAAGLAFAIGPPLRVGERAPGAGKLVTDGATG